MNHGIQLIPASLLAVFLAVPGATAAPKPLRVFILAGQSNMQGQAKEFAATGLVKESKLVTGLE